ncbi:MAG: adenylosuccinate lyase [Spirochaetae bacterium HGW-Spirochaetae-8]|nr:MAG: adenylosuccinate lyase [Spirochaetae bacterium HGW-Spirochaetae-8]
MSDQYTHDTFISPFTWRYGSDEMRSLWSEHHKRLLLRKVWIALATAQHEAGLVSSEQLADLIAHQDQVDIQRASEIEAQIHHDLMAEIRTYAEQCPVGGSVIHLGATSMDILDNMDVVRQKESLELILKRIRQFALELSIRMEQYAEVPCMAYTHIQPAEPTTIGYRLAQTAQDIIDDLDQLEAVLDSLRGKGMKGAVGTSASYAVLLEGTGISPLEMDRRVMEQLGLTSFTAATQVYPRKQDWRLGTALSGLCATLYKFAMDFRLMQSPAIGEWSEPFGSMQVGSSAMPFKRNPINSEKIDSLCRFVSVQSDILWQNAANTLLERTLDDSANRRLVFPEIFLAVDEILLTATKLIKGMQVHATAVERNLAMYGLFAASERLLMELGKRGADRQEMHELLRTHSLAAWAEVQRGRENPLAKLLSQDPQITRLIPQEETLELLDAGDYVGEAPLRTRMIFAQLKQRL